MYPPSLMRQSGRMKTNTFQFKKHPISQVVANALADVTEFDWHDVFYAGTHTDSKGKQNTYTEADLDEIVANFAPQTAPLVIGHPDTNAPAYGWVSGVRKTADLRLEIQAENVNPEFAKAVAAKAFPNRSVRLEKTNQGWQLVHVGYLGAAPPALEGMPWQFAGNAEQAVTYEYHLATSTQRTLLDMLGSLREWMIDKFSRQEADQVIPEYELNWQREQLAAQQANDDTNPLYTKTPNPEDNQMGPFTQEQLDAAVKKAADDAAASVKTEFSQQLSAAEQRAKDAEQKLKAAEFAQQVSANQKLVDAAVTAGKLTPAQSVGYAEFLAHLQGLDAGASFEFSRAEGDSPTQVKTNLFEFAKQHLNSLGTKSPLGDIPPLQKAGPAYSDDEIDAKAIEYQKQHNCDYATAVTAVTGGE